MKPLLSFLLLVYMYIALIPLFHIIHFINTPPNFCVLQCVTSLIFPGQIPSIKPGERVQMELHLPLNWHRL